MKDAREMDRARSHGLRVAPIRLENNPRHFDYVHVLSDEALVRLKNAIERELRARKDRP